jgi:drug/metabolite transporter (DMT)-like permease
VRRATSRGRSDVRQVAPAKIREMNTRTLFGAAVAIWGTTWFAIKFQLEAIAPDFGVVLRFAVAAALVLGWCLWAWYDVSSASRSPWRAMCSRYSSRATRP